MDGEAWISDEPRMNRVLTRVLARAAHRPALVLLVAVLGTGAVVASRLSKPPVYVATLYFRIAEGTLDDPGSGPRPPRAIAEYISNVALTRAQLQRLMEAHGWASAFLARDPVKATDEFRDEVAIEVTRNYFIYERGSDEEPRSAHVAISLRGSDAEKVRGVLHDIGETILKEQADHRNDRLTQSRLLVERQLQVARGRMKTLQEKIADLRGPTLHDRGVGAATRVAALQVEVLGTAEQVLALEKRYNDLVFSATAESANLGLTFDRYDESLVAAAPPLTPRQVLKLSAVVFALFLALTVPVVGAFDDRVYSTADLLAHGLPVFGAMARFPGDQVASFRDRSSGMGR